MGFYVKRKDLNKMKKHFRMQDVSDYEFLQWWCRNHGTSYEKDIKIIQERGD